MNNQNIFQLKIKHRSIETKRKEMYHTHSVSKKSFPVVVNEAHTVIFLMLMSPLLS